MKENLKFNAKVKLLADAWSQLRRNKLAVIGMIGLILIIIMALIGPLMSSHDYARQDVNRRNLPAKIPVLDKVPFLPFDGQGADGTNAYKDAGVKETGSVQTN